MGQNAEVMPRPLNSSIAIYSLEVRTIFFLLVSKKHMLGFGADDFCISHGVEICPYLCGYPVSGTCSRSVNGGLVGVCFSVTPGMAVSMRELRLKVALRF